MNEADTIAQLCAITGVDAPQAVMLLQNAGGDVQMAIEDFFMSMDGGGGGGGGGEGGGGGGGGDGDAMDDGGGHADGDDGANEDASYDDDDDDEGWDEDAPMGLGVYANNPSHVSSAADPPSKRAKVEMRQAPNDPNLSTEDRKLLQQVFGLSTLPGDGASQVRPQALT